MKMINLLKLRTLMLMIVVSSAMILASCNNDDDDSNGGDKTALNALIEEADELATEATDADYPQTAIDAFNKTLKDVKDATKGDRTQVEINNLVTQLNEAMDTFKTKAYGFIDEATSLVAGWHFDEGTGTTATAYSTTKHVATFTKGNATIFGNDAMDPTWVDGVKEGKAVYLNNGAHLEVPYNSAFLPANLTISVWVKPLELYENNYIVSQNFWTGYKLQTQGGGKPFFTYKKADGGIIDADNETDNSIKADQWNHIVITLDGTAKELSFYVNGLLTKTWTETDKGIGPLTQTLTSPDPQPFLIGAAMTGAQLDGTVDTPTSFGYFKGAIDELKLYNMALTEGQVSKLYTDEKP
ncbi:MAG: LamG domain-containing protein [Verrucomicrobia bacterium]|nr:LamG domain-containing protein [Prolixibacteraceae bacterium]